MSSAATTPTPTPRPVRRLKSRDRAGQQFGHQPPVARYFAYQPQRGAAPEARPELIVSRLAENEPPELIAIRDRTPGYQRGSPGRDHGLEGGTRREHHRFAEIDPQNHGPIALLAKHLCVRLAGPRRDPPVDRAQIVALLIRARLVELDTAALERGQVAAGGECPNARRRQADRFATRLERDQFPQTDGGHRLGH